LPAVRRVLRFLLVCFLVVAMPLKGLAAVVVLSGGMTGGMAGGMAPAAVTTQAAARAPAGCPGHTASAAGTAHARQVHPVHHTVVAHTAAPTDSQGQHADSTVQGHADASPLPVPHKCSACDACATAAPLPAQAPRIVPPEVGVARHPRLAQPALCFITEGPDRPPRGPGA
jgi:hypothetical protein